MALVLQGTACACVIGGGEVSHRARVGEGVRENMFKLNSCSLDSERLCFFPDPCVDSGWKGSKEAGIWRNGTSLLLSWTSKWRSALFCVCRPCAGEVVAVAFGWGISLDVIDVNGRRSRQSNATKERWNTTHVKPPATRQKWQCSSCRKQ